MFFSEYIGGISMVSPLLFVFVIMNMLIGIAIPVALFVFLRKKYKLSGYSFWIGVATMFIFAFVLEQILHTIVLFSPAGNTLQNNIWLYALYGGFCAALFEETGRFLAMKFVMKKQHADNMNAIMYGAGHGGFEALYLLVIGMINNLIYSVVINTGMEDMLLAPLDDANRKVLLEAFDTLKNANPWLLLLSPVERFAAVILQICMSVLVWIAVTKAGKVIFVFYSFLLHFAVDFVTASLAGLGVNTILIEVIIWIVALIVLFVTVKIWKKYLADNTVEEATA